MVGNGWGVSNLCASRGIPGRGPFFVFVTAPFHIKCLLGCLHNKAFLFYNEKGPSPGASLGCGPISNGSNDTNSEIRMDDEKL